MGVCRSSGTRPLVFDQCERLCLAQCLCENGCLGKGDRCQCRGALDCTHLLVILSLSFVPFKRPTISASCPYFEGEVESLLFLFFGKNVLYRPSIPCGLALLMAIVPISVPHKKQSPPVLANASPITITIVGQFFVCRVAR